MASRNPGHGFGAGDDGRGRDLVKGPTKRALMSVCNWRLESAR